MLLWPARAFDRARPLRETVRSAMTALPASTGPTTASAARARSAANGAVRQPKRVAKNPYINRELSWLDYAGRVLFEARDARNRLLDRVNFLTIFASMLDEFFQIRISGLRQQLHAGSITTSPDGRTAGEQVAAARQRVLELVAEHSSAWAEVRKALAEEGIEIVKYAAVPEHHETLRQRFIDEIYPVLTPLAVDPGHPFPYISTLSLSIAVGLRDPETDEQHFARVKVPQILPRLYQVEPNRFVLLDQIIEANLDLLFSGMEIIEHHLFRVTRKRCVSCTVMPENRMSRFAAMSCSIGTKVDESTSMSRGTTGGTFTRAKSSSPVSGSSRLTASERLSVEMYGNGRPGSTASGVRTGNSSRTNRSRSRSWCSAISA